MKITNKILISISLVVIVSFGYCAYQGREQVSKRKENYKIYAQIQKSISTGIELEKSIQKIETLEKEYGDSSALKFEKAQVYTSLGQVDKAKVELENMLKLNSSYNNNVGFLITYGENLYKNKENTKAKEVLTKAVELGIPEQYQENVNKILSDIC
ncbi:hypothetical protein CHF27_009045 [Romboutsia maritimum]|uniref:Tetratricopeptide repeat protein n=1 Tax=Romboutsia maritimum TaxID=2020948 RepID=A0A371IS18_9FIRM|nr:hypothetical protein [Romboutsia maritimum]RDY23280.1 hypothetical protein CHF27_009045 [Romboutsia maritimum]